VGLFKRKRGQPIVGRRLGPLLERVNASPQDDAVWDDFAEWGLLKGDFPGLVSEAEHELATTNATAAKSGAPIRLFLTSEAVIVNPLFGNDPPLRWPLARIAYLGSQTLMSSQPLHIEIWEEPTPAHPKGQALDVLLPETQSGLDFNTTIWEHFREARPDLDRFAGGHTVGLGKPPNHP
jgi:hypothetical protein